jgi:HK97 family phage portal protein
MFLTATRRPAEVKSQPRDFDEVIAALDSGWHGTTGSGINVNAVTAMRQATVWACVRIISEIIAQLPIEVHTKQPNGSWEDAEEHDLLQLLAEPNAWQTQHDLIATLIAWSEMQGNGYLFKNTNARNKVLRLLPLQANSVDADMLSDWELRYTVSSEYGPNGIYGPDKVFHLRNFGNDGFRGLSTIGNHREGIGLALQLERHAVSAYQNGLQTSHWVGLESPLSEDELAEFKKNLAKLRGAQKAGETPVFHGATLNSLGGMNLTDAQYIESRRMQKQEIASIFGVPLFLLNDTEKSTTWGTGLEQLSRSFVRFSLNPRLNRLSETMVRELVPPAERRKTRVVFDTDQFTLGEFKERMDGYRSGIEAGVLNPNEAREIEGWNKRDGGEEYRQPMNVGTEGQQQEAPNEG